MPAPSGESLLLDADAILRHLKIVEGMRLGELGCGGRGHFVFPAVRLVGPKGHVYALDIQKTVLSSIERQAREEHCANVSPVWSDLETVGAAKIPAGELDGATLINVLFQSTNQTAILSEARRLIQTGGRLLVVDWRQESAPFGPAPAQRVPRERVVALATQAGFKLEEEFAAGPYHYGLIFIKT